MYVYVYVLCVLCITPYITMQSVLSHSVICTTYARSVRRERKRKRIAPRQLILVTLQQWNSYVAAFFVNKSSRKWKYHVCPNKKAKMQVWEGRKALVWHTHPADQQYV